MVSTLGQKITGGGAASALAALVAFATGGVENVLIYGVTAALFVVFGLSYIGLTIRNERLQKSAARPSLDVRESPGAISAGRDIHAPNANIVVGGAQSVRPSRRESANALRGELNEAIALSSGALAAGSFREATRFPDGNWATDALGFRARINDLSSRDFDQVHAAYNEISTANRWLEERLPAHPDLMHEVSVQRGDDGLQLDADDRQRLERVRAAARTAVAVLANVADQRTTASW